MAHRSRKCVKSPAMAIAAAGGKRHVGKKHALLVAAYAKKEGLSLEEGAALVKAGVDALLGEDPPKSIEALAAAMSVEPRLAAGLMDALVAFGYFGPQG